MGRDVSQGGSEEESEEAIVVEVPEVRDVGGMRSLYLGGITLQSRWRDDDPLRLLLEYTRLMMGFLLFRPEPKRIAMIGLGAGSLAKYCRRKLPTADFTAVEISPAVVDLREELGVPADGPRFRVLCEDGSKFVRHDGEPFDVLLVDGFDEEGQPEALCSAAFYDACAARLGEDGVLVVNLHSDEPDYELWVERIRQAFAGRIIIARAEESENGVVFASAAADFPPPFAQLAATLRELEPQHPVGLSETLRKLAGYKAPAAPRRSRRRTRDA